MKLVRNGRIIKTVKGNGTGTEPVPGYPRKGKDKDMTKKAKYETKKAAKKGFLTNKAGRRLMTYVQDFKNGIYTPAVKFVLKNKKMKPTDYVAFLIFSIPCILTCPHATLMCLTHCYAKSAYMYHNVCMNHVGNWFASFMPDFVYMVDKAINEAMYTKKGTLRKAFMRPDGKMKYVSVRVHESGDFYSTEYMLKWFEIARRHPELHFFAYTKSILMYEAVKDQCPKNFLIRCSIFPDTPAAELTAIENNAFPFYEAVDKFHGDENFKCDCAVGCGECGCQCSKNVRVVRTILKK